jgi:hypothetical protein
LELSPQLGDQLAKVTVEVTVPAAAKQMECDAEGWLAILSLLIPFGSQEQ